MTTSGPLQHIIDNPLNVQRDDCPAAFVGFQEEAVVGVVVEEILRQGCTTEGILQDEEVAFPVGFSFNHLSLRAGKKSTITTTNLPFIRWDEIIKDKALCSALVDRLCHNITRGLWSGVSFLFLR